MKTLSSKLMGYIVSEDIHVTKPKIIRDQVSSILDESVNPNNNVIHFEAELQEANQPNRNGRIYDKEAIDGALRSPVIQEKLKHHTFFGECGHPLSQDQSRQLYIDQNNISHIVTGYRWEGDHLIGTLETANTQVGRDMAGLMEQGSDVAFSMRGMGNVVKNEGKYVRVKAPLMIVSYDYVVIPSHANSYIRSINESGKETTLGSKLENNVQSQGTISKVNLKEMLDMTIRNSENVHALAESFEFEPNVDNVMLENDNRILSLNKQNEQIKVFLEETLTEDLDNYFSMF